MPDLMDQAQEAEERFRQESLKRALGLRARPMPPEPTAVDETPAKERDDT